MKFATIAALAVGASAHHHHHHKWYADHKKGDLEYHPVYHWAKSLIQPADKADQEKCGEVQSNGMVLNHWRLKHTVYTNFVQGFYQDRIENQISDKCFDEANIKNLEPMLDIFHKIKRGDFFAISIEEHKAAVMSVIDLFWNNVENCRYMVPIQDALNWCKDNTDKCIHKHGLIERLQENAVDMAFTLWDLFYVLTRDKTCEGDNETLDAIGKATYDITKMYSEQLGFDYTFDSEKEVSHDSLKSQWDDLYITARDLWPEHSKVRCPFRPWFDKIHAVKHAIKDELRDDKYEVMKMWGHFMHKIHHKEHKIQKHLAKMWHQSEEKSAAINQSWADMFAHFAPHHEDIPSPAQEIIDMPNFFEQVQWGERPEPTGFEQGLWGPPPPPMFGMPEWKRPEFGFPNFNLF